MNTSRYVHKNITLPVLPTHEESRQFQNITSVACLGLGLLATLSLVVILL